MSGCNLYYIYIDTKILGAVEQLVSYFQTQVFNNKDCIEVVCKYYKEIENSFSKIFDSNEIPFRFVKKNSDYKFLERKVVFYLFNAQSNCKVVANRNLIHIFVTHGESHKLASIKPIIRIYDYVVTSGKVGIDRYLKSGIFTPYDIEGGKVITLGDTFVGSNNFQYVESSDSIVYAPTWEGGVPEENYCSISQTTANKIIEFCAQNNIRNIYIQPHPNLGHRDITYKAKLNLLIKTLQTSNLQVINNNLKKHQPLFSIFARKTNTSKTTTIIDIKLALTDISAMEMQFVSKGIPCMVLTNSDTLSQLFIPKVLEEYRSKVFYSEEDSLVYRKGANDIRNELFNYLITYPSISIKKSHYDKRIKWLCNYAIEHQDKRNSLLANKY